MQPLYRFMCPVLLIAAGGSSVPAQAQGLIPSVCEAWGLNTSGQSETGYASSSYSGVGLSAVAAGHYHTLRLHNSGYVDGIGSNTFGQLSVPAFYDFARIAAGCEHSVGLRANGSVVAWGRNLEGQCFAPITLGFVGVAAGDRFSMALSESGSVVC